MVVFAVLGVYLLQTTPELRDAARREAPPASSPPATERSTPSAPIPVPPPERDQEAERKREFLSREAEPKPKREDRQTPRPPSEDQTKRAPGDEEQKSVTSPPPPSAQEAPKAEAPAARSQMSRSTEAHENALGMADTDRKGARGAAPAVPPMLSAKQQMAAPVVSGALTVTDRQRAEQSLTELIRKTSAREVSRREESGAVVVEVAVPQAEYAAFTRELATLGSLRLEGQPTEIPPLVRLSVRISE